MNRYSRMSGGHENAAGCTLHGPLRRAIHRILAELRTAQASFTAVSASPPLRFRMNLLALTLL